MALNERVQNRLWNWKFQAAFEEMYDATNATDEEAALVTALAKMLGNPGWFHGDLAVVIEVALKSIGIDGDE